MLLLLPEGCNVAMGCWRTLWVKTCSFCGGAGDSSDAEGATSPRGPRGSSTVSRRTWWATARRGVRGWRPAGDLRDWVGSRDGGFDFDDSVFGVRGYIVGDRSCLPVSSPKGVSEALAVVGAWDGTSVGGS